MQTFLCYADFAKSAKCLDNKRLGKQRCECKQIYLALTLENYGWENHPAVKMWEGCCDALLEYMICICMEWRERGFKDTLLDWAIKQKRRCQSIQYPKWLGDERLHASHRSNLLRKDHGYYGKFGWKEPNDLPYFWPTKGQNEHIR